MSAVFIAAVFAAAYLYLIKSTDTRYRIHRMDGYRLYFYVASWASIFASLSAVVVFLIDIADIPTTLFPELLDKNGNIDKLRGIGGSDAKVIALSLMSFIWAGLLWFGNFLHYTFVRDAKESLTIELTKGNPFERLLTESSIDFGTICVTCKSGKVYVGLVHEFDPDRGKLEYLALLPILSGYRTGKRNKIKFTTNYYKHYIELEESSFDVEHLESQIEKFRVVLPCTEVASLSKFDIEDYRKINDNHQE